MPNYKRIGVTLSSGFLVEIFNKFVPFILYSFALRKLGADAFGFALFGISIIEASIPFIQWGYNTRGSVSIGKAKGDRQQISEIISNIMPIKMAGGFVVFTVLAVLTLFVESYAPYHLLILSLSFSFLAGACECQWVHLGIQKLSVINVITFPCRLISLSLTLMLVRGPEDATLFAVLILLNNALIALFTLIYTLRSFPLQKPQLPLMFVHFKRSVMLGLLTISVTLLSKVDIIIAERLFPPLDLGRYAGITRIEHAITMILSVFYLTFFSEMLGVESRVERQKHINMSLLTTWTVLCPIICGSFLVGGDLLTLIYDGSFQTFSLPFSFLLLGSAMTMLLNVFGMQILVVESVPRTIVISSLVSIVVIASLSVSLLDWSFVGLSFAVFFGKMLVGLSCILRAKKFVNFPFRQFFLPVLPSFMMFLVLYVTPKINVLISVIIGALLYALFWYLFFPKDLKKIMSRMTFVLNRQKKQHSTLPS